jgi:fucose permease
MKTIINRGGESAGKSKGGNRIIISFMFASMLIFAISSTMIGIILPDMMEDYDLNNIKVSLFSVSQSVGGIIAIPIEFLIADRFPKLNQIILFFLLEVAVLILIGLKPSFGTVLVLFALIGLITSFLNMLLSAYISEFSENKMAGMNLLHGFFSLGSLLGPIYTGFILSRGQTWNTSFTILGMVCFAIATALIVLKAVLRPAEKVQGEANHSGQEFFKDILHLLLDKRLFWLALFNCIFMSYQSGVVSWIAVYLQNGLGRDSALSSAALTLFWTGIMIGRFTEPLITKKIPSEKFLNISLLISATGYTAVFALRDSTLIIAMLVIAGILLGAVYPSVIAIACRWFPDKSGTVTTSLGVFSYIIGTIMAFLIGGLMDRVGYNIGIMVLPALILFSFFLFMKVSKISG